MTASDERVDVGLLVVGGGPAGLEAARAYRAHDGAGRVVMLTKDEHPPYQRPPLTKDYLRGDISEHELPLEDDTFYLEQGIEVELESRAVALDPAGRRVRTEGGRVIDYESCVLALGSVPAPLPVPGGSHPDVRLLRSRSEGSFLREAAAKAGSVVVVGSGFIGCEAAASLRACGCEVTIVSSEPKPQLDRLGDEVASRIASWLEDDGVELRGGVDVTSIDDGRAVRLSHGNELTADLVLVATGVRREVAWVESAGVECRDGLVVTSSRMATSAPGLYAAGDVALAYNDAAGQHLSVEHWGEALRMGEVAGTCAAGAVDTWAEVPGFWSDVGGRTLKYHAWGTGHDVTRMVSHSGGGFTVWYGRDGILVGVLTHEADEDYERGGDLVREGAPFPA